MDIAALIPQFGGLIYMIVAFVLALSVIVAVHEYGHYIVGRWSGIHAEVFSLGFGPVLWSRDDKHGTRWQIALLPFGGYVKFLGDANAASGKDEGTMADLEQDPAALRRTMHGAPLWARAATVAAGPVFNFALSILVFASIFMARGVATDPLTIGELKTLPNTVQELQIGDEIQAINGKTLPKFDDADGWTDYVDSLEAQKQLEFTVNRDGQTQTVTGPWLFPPLVQQVAPRSAAMDIELASGDVITAVDGQDIFAFEQLKEAVEGSDGRVLLLSVWRDGEMLEFALAPRRTDEPQPEGGFVTHWRVGIVGGMMLVPATEAGGVGMALTDGVVQTGKIIQGSLSGLWHMVTGAISTCNISGPIGIAETSGAMASQGAQSFIWFIAVLSTAIGMLNLFPIPALDGGHLVFYAYEAVTGKPPSDTVLRFLMAIGITMILSLMVFSLGNDLFC
ncbi:RIP metalloprotease RseP [Phaeobacter gallaeciensis]|uniref:Zinc metalloprotease n=2 Tax=Roseobacteraceae TaxID=2854170 RepID=A0A366WRD6_9RHOB|nr:MULTISPECIES: RIP metalloprotease RseP [Roseobacteraceae]MBT3140613.1 RIP metalloprotease RseP [Falsiruegeria litorea]RBW52585.1 RIP metalloprotease RseP [Phaeobacter gallaeciensis]